MGKSKKLDYKDFYEGRFKDRKKFNYNSKGIIGRLFRSVTMDYSHRRSYFLNKYLEGTNNKILDIGCGGGTLLFKEHGMVTGLDISESSLEKAREIYDQAILGEITEMPFDDNTFDYVVSIDVLGHIPKKYKQKAWSEIYRVLKPGGVSIHSSIETEGRDWLSSYVRKDEKNYKDLFIDFHGHHGYEFPSEAISRFKDCGFEILGKKKIQGGIFVDPWFYIEWFWKSSYLKHPILFILTLISKTINAIDNRIFRARILFPFFKFFLGLITYPIDGLLSIDYTRSLAIALKK